MHQFTGAHIIRAAIVLDMQQFDNLNSIRRINIVGTTGSGKSTFGKRLAEIIQAPYLEIDKMFWGPDWTSVNDDVLFKRIETNLQAEKWVLDGNYNRTTPIKWKQVQLVIWLDYPFWKVMTQLTKRAITRALSGAELWEGTGNKESFRKLLSKDSIILWGLKTYRKNRTQYTKAMEDENYSHIKFIRFSNPGEAERFLKGIKNNVKML